MSVYELDEECFTAEDYVYKNFPVYDMEWLEFVVACRQGTDYTNYDIVEGPMANDTVWNYVTDIIKGTITKKQFWVLAEFKHPTHQISFHTLSALNCLNFKKSEIVYDRRTEE